MQRLCIKNTANYNSNEQRRINFFCQQCQTNGNNRWNQRPKCTNHNYLHLIYRLVSLFSITRVIKFSMEFLNSLADQQLYITLKKPNLLQQWVKTSIKNTISFVIYTIIIEICYILFCRTNIISKL